MCSTSAGSHVPLFSPVAVLSLFSISYSKYNFRSALRLKPPAPRGKHGGVCSMLHSKFIFVSHKVSLVKPKRSCYPGGSAAMCSLMVISSYGNMLKNMALCCFASSAQLAGHAVRLVRLDSTKPFEIWHKEVWQMLTQHGRQSWYAYFPHWWRAPILPAEWDKWWLTSKHWTMPLLDQHLRVLVSG